MPAIEPTRAVAPIRLLVLHSELGVLQGGGENFSRYLFAAFARRGHHVSAAFVADRRGRYAHAVPNGVEAIPVRGWWSNNLGQGTASLIGGLIPGRTRLRQICDRAQEALAWRAFSWHQQRFRRRVMREFEDRWDEFDVVYVHGDVLLAHEVARHRPTVLRLPGLVPEVYARLLRSVHAVCANGDALLRTRRFMGDRALELPVGLDHDVFAPGPTEVRSQLGWSDEDYVIGYVGRLAHLKGVDLLVAAFREVTRSTPSARLLIVGRGEQEGLIRSVLAEECKRGLVHVEPSVGHDRLPGWYRAMDLLVMPSRYENCSNALLEGMACGVPFLASDVGGNRQLSESGAGWLFEPESARSLADWLLRLADAREERARRGRTGATEASSRHTWTASAERLERLLRSLTRPVDAPAGVRPIPTESLSWLPHK